MKLKNLFIFMFLLVFGLVLVACNGQEVTITLDADITMTAGEKAYLKPGVVGIEEFVFVYSSEDASVVDVDQTGYVRALKAGSSKITVSLRDTPDVTAEVNVTVKAKVTLDDFAPTAIVVAGDAELKLNTSSKLTATLTPATANAGLIWVSSNPEVVNVLSDGTVYAKGYGVATITAKSAIKDSVSATFEIKVVADGTEEEVANSAVDYLVAQLPEYVHESFAFPTHPNPEVVVEWKNSTSQVKTEYDFAATRDGSETISLKVVYGSVEKTKSIQLKLVVDLNNNLHAKLPYAAAAINAYMNAVGTDITEDLMLYTDVNGVKVTWTSNTVAVIKADGTFIRPHNDTNVKLTANLGHSGASQTLVFNVVAKGYTADEKVNHILNEGVLKTFVNSTTSSNMSFPLVDEKFGASLTWESQSPTVMDNEGKYVDLNLAVETAVTYKITIKYTVEGFAFEKVVDVVINVKPLNDIGRAIIAFQELNFELPHVAFGASPQLPDQLTNLPTSLEGHDGVTISWVGKEGEFSTDMKVLIPRVLYTQTEVYATFTKEGLDDAVIALPVNIGILSSSETDFAFTVRTPGYQIGQDQTNGMPKVEGGTGTVYALGFESFYFKANFERTVGEEKVTKDWYFFFAPGNIKETTAAHLKDVDGKKFVDTTVADAIIKPLWGSATRFFKNTTDQTIYVDKDDIVTLGAQAGSDAYKPFVLDKDGYVTTIATPAMAFSPEGFEAYEIPAGGMLVCPGYLEAGVNPNLHHFANTLGRKIDILTLTGWTSYTAPTPAA